MVVFLGDLKTPKFHSEINWPLVSEFRIDWCDVLNNIFLIFTFNSDTNIFYSNQFTCGSNKTMRWDSVAKGLFGAFKKYVDMSDWVFHNNKPRFTWQFLNRKKTGSNLPRSYSLLRLDSVKSVQVKSIKKLSKKKLTQKYKSKSKCQKNHPNNCQKLV